MEQVLHYSSNEQVQSVPLINDVTWCTAHIYFVYGWRSIVYKNYCFSLLSYQDRARLHDLHSTNWLHQVVNLIAAIIRNYNWKKKQAANHSWNLIEKSCRDDLAQHLFTSVVIVWFSFLTQSICTVLQSKSTEPAWLQFTKTSKFPQLHQQRKIVADTQQLKVLPISTQMLFEGSQPATRWPFIRLPHLGQLVFCVCACSQGVSPTHRSVELHRSSCESVL